MCRIARPLASKFFGQSRVRPRPERMYSRPSRALIQIMRREAWPDLRPNVVSSTSFSRAAAARIDGSNTGSIRPDVGWPRSIAARGVFRPRYQEISQLLDDPQRFLAAMSSLDVGKAVREPPRKRLPGWAGGVRREDDIRQVENGMILGRRLLTQNVEPGAQNSALAERGCEGFFIDQAAARRIDQNSGWLHQRQRFGVNEIARMRVERHVHRYGVSHPQQRVQLDVAHAKLLLALG